MDIGLHGDPISYTIAKHGVELVEILLEVGADPNRRYCAPIGA